MEKHKAGDKREKRSEASNAVAEEPRTADPKSAESMPEPSVEAAAQPENPAERIAQLEDNLARARADYQNLQRRITTERADAVLYANTELMKSLVAVLDDFDRAAAAADASDNLKAVVDGVHLVHKNLHRALSAAGLEVIDPLHQPFDPAVHEALLKQPTDEQPAGTVVEVVGKGYKLRDRVIRPARVIVAAPPETSESAKT